MNQRSPDVKQAESIHSIGNLPGSRSKYAIIAVVLIAVIVGLYFLSRVNYPLFHSIADMTTVLIAVSVFVVVWYGRRILDNHYYLFVGISFLFFSLFWIYYTFWVTKAWVFSCNTVTWAPHFISTGIFSAFHYYWPHYLSSAELIFT